MSLESALYPRTYRGRPTPIYLLSVVAWVNIALIVIHGGTARIFTAVT